MPQDAKDMAAIIKNERREVFKGAFVRLWRSDGRRNGCGSFAVRHFEIRSILSFEQATVGLSSLTAWGLKIDDGLCFYSTRNS